MLEDREFFFWQEIPSIHQAPYVRALADILPNGHVWSVFSRGLDDERRSMGWSEPNYQGTKIVFESDGSRLQRIYQEHRAGTVHIFSSMHSESQIRRVFLFALKHRPLLIGILGEGFDRRGTKGFLRILRAELFDRRIIRNLDFVLSIGQMSQQWYRHLGVPAGRLFPFPYVVELPPATVTEASSPSRPYQIVFVGALIRRKNVNALIRVLNGLKNDKWFLHIVGDGPQRSVLEELVSALDLTGKIGFTGVLANESVRQLLNQSDLLVLPSIWDGWGAVVNEALTSGVPVLCSNYCGAADLICPGVNGDVFTLDDLRDFEQKLGSWLARGKLDLGQRAAIRRWAQSISGQSTAEYLVDIVTFTEQLVADRPKPPWLEAPSLK